MAETKSAGLSAAVVVEWTLKIGPVLLGAILWIFSLYTNQAAMIKHDADVDRRMGELEKAQNVQDRALVERLAKMDATLSELNHDLQFYQSVRNGK